MAQHSYPALAHIAENLTEEGLILGPSAILARRYVPELQELLAMRSKGWNEETLDDHFKWQRTVADNPDKEVASTWFHMMKKVMQEIDLASGCISPLKPIEFLDVGCSSGGLSSYVLRKNRHARGTGISLPAVQGGHIFLLEESFLPRYEFIEKDILAYDISPFRSDSTTVSSQRLPGRFLRRFSLVLLGESASRTYHHPVEPAPEDRKTVYGAYRDSLLITQLIIGLETVCPGGTIVMRLSHVECWPSAILLYLLDHLSDKLTVHKPRTMHASRGTCFVIAKGACGMQHAKARQQYLSGLRELLVQLRSGGRGGRGRMILPGDLDFVATAETILTEYLDRLVELGRGVWSTQVQGLDRLFRKKGIQ
ncbi:hypothetical protein BD309DRAFT_965875 [Dichomitus squalens]|uniref:Ribosomal RNA methyltransferase FtsJ domain-containing protein n=1 Tax=Dichomitus squalens TaxID=114155 RepID=A0A4V2K3M6_9APHY|nr:hypothetical protein BD309DRAFT_965875 [Dichomitus squalens]TBU61540.1 hypothetical protein BD310DRAFT_920936 [Dichomitus squalens]